MKPDFFRSETLLIERTRNREGPPVTYTVWRPNTSRIFTNTKDALKFIRWPRGTVTGDALREWFDSFADKDTKAQPTTLDKAEVVAKGFGPESHDESPDPTTETKMVT